MNKDEALRLALEALISCHNLLEIEVNKAIARDAADAWVQEKEAELRQHNNAITAIKAALEAKDEPVAFFDWYDNAHWGNEDFKEGCHRAWNAAIKYTTPPQRTWVGLKDDDEINWDGGDLKSFVKAIEAKLKEKNNG